jgi:hypothetical protein
VVLVVTCSCTAGCQCFGGKCCLHLQVVIQNSLIGGYHFCHCHGNQQSHTSSQVLSIVSDNMKMPFGCYFSTSKDNFDILIYCSFLCFHGSLHSLVNGFNLVLYMAVFVFLSSSLILLITYSVFCVKNVCFYGTFYFLRLSGIALHFNQCLVACRNPKWHITILVMLDSNNTHFV